MKKTGFLNYFAWLLLIALIFAILDSIIHFSVETLEVYYYQKVLACSGLLDA